MKKYTPEQCAQVAEALRAAKRYLGRSHRSVWTPNKERFICYAIEVAYERGFTTAEAAELARRMIAHRLGGAFYTLEGFVRTHTTSYYSLSAAALVDKMQKHRHAWLDQLIDEFTRRSQRP